MADSPNSTTIPKIDRRRMLTGAAAVLAATSTGAVASSNATPVLALWERHREIEARIKIAGQELGAAMDLLDSIQPEIPRELADGRVIFASVPDHCRRIGFRDGKAQSYVT